MLEDGELPEGAALKADRRQLQPHLCKFASTQVSGVAVFNCGPGVPQLDNIVQGFLILGRERDVTGKACWISLSQLDASKKGFEVGNNRCHLFNC